MQHVFVRISACLMLLCCTIGAVAQTAEPEFSQQVGAFIDGWHADAAQADYRYFDKMAPDGVFIGTDKSERWVRDDFKAWARPFFDRKKAWEFHAFNRHIAYTPDHALIWFDEQLHTRMGICQASGVIRNTPAGLQIAHYQLSLTIPNELLDGIQKQIEVHEAGAH